MVLISYLVLNVSEVSKYSVLSIQAQIKFIELSRHQKKFSGKMLIKLSQQFIKLKPSQFNSTQSFYKDFIYMAFCMASTKFAANALRSIKL